MYPFATEFPVKPIASPASFVAEIVGWLRGMEYSTVLSSHSSHELDRENAHLRSANGGEELRLRELRVGDTWDAVGFRHDLPDGEGRLWRTEGVVRREAGPGGESVLRLRTQCLAKVSGANLAMPRKPYLVKALLKNDWSETDAALTVSDKPIWLDCSDTDVGLATAINYWTSDRMASGDICVRRR